MNTIDIPIWPRPIAEILEIGWRAQEKFLKEAESCRQISDQLTELQVCAIFGLPNHGAFDGGLLEKVGFPKDVLIEGAVVVKRAESTTLALTAQVLKSPLQLSNDIAAIADVQSASRTLAKTERWAATSLVGKEQETKIREKVLGIIETKLLGDSATGQAEILVRNEQLRFTPADENDERSKRNISQRDDTASRLRVAREREAISRRLLNQRLKRRVTQARDAAKEAIFKARGQKLPQQLILLAAASGLVQGGKNESVVLNEVGEIDVNMLRVAALLSLSRV